MRAAGPPRTKIIVLAALTVVVVILVVVAVLISGDAGKKKTAAKPAPDPNSPTTLPASSLTVFHDNETGSTIRYPIGWQRLQAPSRDVRLVASAPGGTAALLLRVERTEQATTPANLANVKAITDGIVGSNNGAQVLKEQAINDNGLIGFYYLYLFKDANGLDAVHAHYFLFQGHKMNSIVLEADPGDGFTKLTGLFDQIADSFRSDPEPADTTTTPG